MVEPSLGGATCAPSGGAPQAQATHVASARGGHGRSCWRVAGSKKADGCGWRGLKALQAQGHAQQQAAHALTPRPVWLKADPARAAGKARRYCGRFRRRGCAGIAAALAAGDKARASANAAGVNPAPVASARSSSCPTKATQRSTSTAAFARASAGWSGARGRLAPASAAPAGTEQASRWLYAAGAEPPGAGPRAASPTRATKARSRRRSTPGPCPSRPRLHGLQLAGKSQEGRLQHGPRAIRATRLTPTT